MSSHTATLLGLITNGIGTLFLLFDSIRISNRLRPKGVSLSDSSKMQFWYFRYAPIIGFSFLFAGFVLQLLGLLCE
jgi:hypothetical protein